MEQLAIDSLENRGYTLGEIIDPVPVEINEKSNKKLAESAERVKDYEPDEIIDIIKEKTKLS